jgi:hypothetical protein
MLNPQRLAARRDLHPGKNNQRLPDVIEGETAGWGMASTARALLPAAFPYSN